MELEEDNDDEYTGYFSQLLCRFRGDLSMGTQQGSAVVPLQCGNLGEPDWGNRIRLSDSTEDVNCCVEYNSRVGFVVRQSSLILYNHVCELMRPDEHIESVHG